MTIKQLFAICSACLCATTAFGAERDFSYNFSGDEPYGFGTGKAETYDVAIKIDNPDMAGLRVLGLRVPLTGDIDGISSFKGFLTTELRTRNENKKKVNDPDICECEGTVSDGILTVTFETPYEITENGIYIGYSLTVDEGHESAEPIAVIDGFHKDGMWFHATSSQLKWNDYAKNRNLTSAISVILDGDFLQNAAAASIASGQFAEADNPFTLKATLVNNGTDPIESISYSLKIGGTDKDGTLEFSEPIATGPGYPFEIELPAEAPSSYGMCSMELTVAEVNGLPNNSRSSAAQADIEIVPFIPVNRPLVEEYTGLRCVWCPQGYVMLEEMGELHGDDFVALSFHSSSYENGCMVFMETHEFPFRPSGYPQAQVNRNSVNSIFDVPAAWDKAASQPTVADVKAELKWADEEKTLLEAVSTVRFIRDIQDSHYRISFTVVADSLSNPSWRQSNAYASEDMDVTGLEGPWWDLFIHTDSEVTGLIFNDVAVDYPDTDGVEGMLPSEIEAGRGYESRLTVDTRRIRNIDGEDVIGDFSHIRVVAIVTDGAGKPVNCVSTGYPSKDSGIVMTEDSPAVKEVRYYSLTGNRVDSGYKGIVIKTETLEDGSTRASRILK